jgi:hypothetical protein
MPADVGAAPASATAATPAATPAAVSAAAVDASVVGGPRVEGGLLRRIGAAWSGFFRRLAGRTA